MASLIAPWAGRGLEFPWFCFSALLGCCCCLCDSLYARADIRQLCDLFFTLITIFIIIYVWIILRSVLKSSISVKIVSVLLSPWTCVRCRWLRSPLTCLRPSVEWLMLVIPIVKILMTGKISWRLPWYLAIIQKSLLIWSYLI